MRTFVFHQRSLKLVDGTYYPPWLENFLKISRLECLCIMLFGLNDKCYRSYNDDDVKVTETQKANKGEQIL